MKYKVTAGKHVDGQTTYKKGDKFESDLELDKMFPNKFERLEPTYAPEPIVPSASAPPGTPAAGPTLPETPRDTKDTAPPDEPDKSLIPGVHTRGRPGRPKRKIDWDDAA